ACGSGKSSGDGSTDGTRRTKSCARNRAACRSGSAACFCGGPSIVGHVKEISLFKTIDEVPNLTFSFFKSKAISLLQFSYELVFFTIDLINFVVSQFSPFFLYMALHFSPVAFNFVPVHN